ncbi:MAG: GDP-mannose 4,6-dehydratase [Candidatus Diapherotrites archaeon]|uniref:GDP-mannose 4,6-dehydratase n=1 Tax=Candidatus Iainarchaeum sp. TaxID=3101447 RepID=A0A938YRQ6_9ARCH|nr:GDP-mannose 4,6-dehydratase [Candidatus Diapherotrites archaeon]
MAKENFWNGKRVLVTGASGFIGSHLTEALLNNGAEVSVFIKWDSSAGSRPHIMDNLEPIKGKLKNVLKGDISSEDTMKSIKANNPEVILHLAAEAYVNYIFDHPAEVLKANLLGTLNVLHAAMDLKELKQVVCTSSSEVYGTAQTDSIDELHPMNPTSPYAASKAAADRYCYSYWKTYGLPIAIIRPFNTYGPRHTYDVIPKFIELALKNEPLTVYGTGEQSRDFTYVSDMVEAFMLMASRKEAVGKAVNFGNGKDYSINFIAEKVKELSGSKSKIVHVEQRKAEVQRLICNYGLAKKLFGWQPKVSIEEGLKKNIEWVEKRK